MNKSTRGSAHVIIIVLIIVALVGVLGYMAWNAYKKAPVTNNVKSDGTKISYIDWSFDGSVWKPASTPPNCEQPLLIGAPMDVSKATSKLYPGQVRGTDFKPHGGLAVDTAASTSLNVYAIRDAYLFRGSRYIENDVIQYLLDFMDPCGIFYRYDHIATLSKEVKKLTDQLPEPKLDDSRTVSFSTPVFIKKGATIATAVGKTGNTGFDLGVYDLRTRNEASKTELYKTDARRIQDKEQSFYSVCWFDLLPPKERDIVNELPSRSGVLEGTSSDYCEIN